MSNHTSVASAAIQLMSRADATSRQWVHLIPAGTFHGVDGRGPYSLMNANAVIEASRERAGRRYMPIDYDHATDLAAPKGGTAPAAGWIDALQSRTDGIWGRVEWTPRAAEQLAGREYRYLSPVFNHASDGTISRLLRAALTNTPNLDQLTALASMETTTVDRLSELRTLLGLPDDATIDAILNAITELTTARQSMSPDPSKFVPIGDFTRVVSEVNRLNQGISLQAATDHVVAQVNGGLLPPFLKDWGISLCSMNKPAFDKFMERTGGKVYATIFGPSGAKLVPPPDRGALRSDLTTDEIAIASNLGVSPDALLQTKTARATAQNSSDR